MASNQPKPKKWPVIVLFTRMAPRRLDRDNLSNSFKEMRDELTNVLGLKDDKGPEVDWRYSQEKSKDYRVRVMIRAVPGVDHG